MDTQEVSVNLKNSILSHLQEDLEEEEQEGTLQTTNSTKNGSILIRCEGGYSAKFRVEYKYNGQDFSKEKDNITLGVSKSVKIPANATNLYLKVEEWWGFGWSTIFTKNFEHPVNKCYKVYGTTLNPKYKEIEC